jgi:hypothetical protein
MRDERGRREGVGRKRKGVLHVHRQGRRSVRKRFPGRRVNATRRQVTKGKCVRRSRSEAPTHSTAEPIDTRTEADRALLVVHLLSAYRITLKSTRPANCQRAKSTSNRLKEEEYNEPLVVSSLLLLRLASDSARQLIRSPTHLTTNSQLWLMARQQPNKKAHAARPAPFRVCKFALADNL